MAGSSQATGMNQRGRCRGVGPWAVATLLTLATAGPSGQTADGQVDLSTIHRPGQEITPTPPAPSPTAPSGSVAPVVSPSGSLLLPFLYHLDSRKPLPPTFEQLPDAIQAVAAGGRLAYLVSDQELIVVNAEDPSQPSVAGRVALGWPDATQARDLLWLGTRVIVLGGDLGACAQLGNGSFLLTVDVSRPDQPRIVQRLPLAECAFSIAAAGPAAILLPVFKRQATCAGSETGLAVFAVTEEGGLVRRICHPMPDHLPIALAAEGGKAVVASLSPVDETDGVEGHLAISRLDLAAPQLPQDLEDWGSLPAEALSGVPIYVTLQQGTAVVGSRSGGALWISGRGEPKGEPIVAELDDSEACSIDALIAAAGSWYLRRGFDCLRPSLQRWTGALALPEVEDQASRLIISDSVDLSPERDAGQGTGWHTMAAADGLVYLVDGNGGSGSLVIIDTRDAGGLRIVGRLD